MVSIGLIMHNIRKVMDTECTGGVSQSSKKIIHFYKGGCIPLSIA